MSETEERRTQAISPRDRLLLVALAVGLAALMVAAAVLTPDPSGMGTHQQFGLPPCTFKLLAGVPCPSCGMTTSWSFLVRGRLFDAFLANAGGALLGLLAAAAVPWLLACGIRGRWLGWVPDCTVLAWAGVAIVLVTLVHWGLRLYLGR